MNYAVLVVNGQIRDFFYYKSILQSSKLIVSADGGANILYENRYKSDYIVGDLDSISKEALEYYKHNNSIIKKYPTKKDKTDTQISIEIIKKLNIFEIILIGASGDRIDHFLSNINLMYYSKKLGVNIRIIDEKNELILLTERENFVDTFEGQTISFVPLKSSVKSITLKGFEYEIENYDLEDSSSILTSNIAKGNKVFVGIGQGSLLCVKINKIDC